MAHVSKEKKAKIAAALAAAMPKDWKYTLKVDSHSTIVMTISQAPVPPDDLVRKDAGSNIAFALNPYYPAQTFSGKTLELVVVALQCLNTDNFDKSEPMSDYFHVGHYVDIQFGRWDKPFVNTFGQDPKKPSIHAKSAPSTDEFRL